MRPVRQALTAIGVSTPVVVDHYTNPNNCAVGVKIAGGAATGTYTVEHTYDDVFSTTFDPATAVWYPHPTLAAKTVNADGYYWPQPMAIRLNAAAVGAGATLTMTVIPGGMGGV